MQLWSSNYALLGNQRTSARAGTSNEGLISGGYTGIITAGTQEYNCGANQIAGAGLQCFIANITMETE